MLLPEIQPFADAHVANLKAVKDDLESLTNAPGTTVDITADDIDAHVKNLQAAIRGFERFAACAIDEWKTKERLETQVRDCRLNHK